MHGGGEHVEDGGTVTETAVSSVHEPPPEQRRAAEERKMLDDVHRFVLERGVVQRRQMPHPQRRGMNTPDGRRRGHDGGRRDNRWTADREHHAAARAGRKNPEERDQRRRCSDERRCRKHQQLVLRHVRRKQLLAQLVEPDERGDEREPAADERECLRVSNALPRAGMPPEARDAHGIQTKGRTQNDGNHCSLTR